MCKKQIYKTVRQIANKAIGHIVLCNPDVYGAEWLPSYKPDRVRIDEALMGYFCVAMDVIKEISGQYYVDRLIRFQQALVEDLSHRSFAWLVTELKSVYDNYIDFISKTDVGIYLYTPHSESYIVQWMYDSRLFNINTYDRGWTKSATRAVAQILLFLSKVELEGELESLEQKAIDKWFDAEKSNNAMDAQENTWMYNHLYDLLAEVVGYWFKPSFKINLDYARNGSGSTNMVTLTPCSRKNPLNKWIYAEINTASYRLLNSILSDRSMAEVNPFMTVTDRDLTSEFITVAKNVSSRRGISLEPPGLQFLQQGIRLSAVHYIKNTRDKFPNAIGNYVFLEDNTFNRSLARVGSVTGEYSTADLSSASDCVRHQSVKKVFKLVPQVLKWLIATRTRYVQIAGQKIKVSKFAGMGSGCCFWVETVMFCAIAWLATFCAANKRSAWDVEPRDIRTALRNPSSLHGWQMLVYGDDMIVHKEAYDTLVTLLDLLGFTVNNDKSFKDGYFKESCGGNYFHGIDITPIKWNVQFGTDTIIGPEAFTGLIDYANLSYKKGWSILREHCIQRLLTSGNLPVFTDDEEDSSKIYSPNPTNFHLKKAKPRIVTVSGEKLTKHQGWPHGVWFRERVVLFTRERFKQTVLETSALDQNTIDFWNTPLGLKASEYSYGNCGRDAMQYRQDMISYIEYLDSTTKMGNDTIFDCSIDKSYDRIHWTYHLADPTPKVRENRLEDRVIRKVSKYKEL